VVAHVSFADPICPVTRAALYESGVVCGARVHDGGVYVCMEGPAFSTRAESRLYRSWDVDVIGMTNLHEAKLAREAEICYATLALVTDYDCWHEEEEDVSVGAVLENLRANSRLAADVVRDAIGRLSPDRSGCRCARALDHALITPRENIPAAVRERLAPILARTLS
jgi:5'-methylthioadenosine phosphorylase